MSEPKPSTQRHLGKMRVFAKVAGRLGAKLTLQREGKSIFFGRSIAQKKLMGGLFGTGLTTKGGGAARGRRRVSAVLARIQVLGAFMDAGEAANSSPEEPSASLFDKVIAASTKPGAEAPMSRKVLLILRSLSPFYPRSSSPRMSSDYMCGSCEKCLLLPNRVHPHVLLRPTCSPPPTTSFSVF